MVERSIRKTGISASDDKKAIIVGTKASRDQAALADLYREHGEQLAAYLRKAFGDGPPDPDDVAQEAFHRLVQQESLDRIKNLRAFLWRTARNILLSQKRNIESRSRFDYEIEHLFFASKSPAATPERVLVVREQLKIVAEVLKKMPDRRRKAFLWNRVEGLTLTAIGTRLGITRRAVARHVIQAAYDLETTLQDVSGG
ncbi:MAG: sigma-70 family RNA polymerase sigma factor [Pseudomonadota bacterium]